MAAGAGIGPCHLAFKCGGGFRGDLVFPLDYDLILFHFRALFLLSKGMVSWMGF